MPTVLVTDYAWPSLDIERDVLATAGASLLVAPTGDERELVELAADADEAVQELQRKAATNVLDILRGRRPAYPINPAVLDSAIAAARAR